MWWAWRVLSSAMWRHAINRISGTIRSNLLPLSSRSKNNAGKNRQEGDKQSVTYRIFLQNFQRVFRKYKIYRVMITIFYLCLWWNKEKRMSANIREWFHNFSPYVALIIKQIICIYTYCTVLGVLVGFTDYTTQLFTIFYCRLHGSVLQSFHYSQFWPLISYVGAVCWCLPSSNAGYELTWLLVVW
jgi:hypothetical protein